MTRKDNDSLKRRKDSIHRHYRVGGQIGTEIPTHPKSDQLLLYFLLKIGVDQVDKNVGHHPGPNEL